VAGGLFFFAINTIPIAVTAAQCRKAGHCRATDRRSAQLSGCTCSQNNKRGSRARRCRNGVDMADIKE
jgi:hypothetical protein